MPFIFFWCLLQLCDASLAVHLYELAMLPFLWSCDAGPVPFCSRNPSTRNPSIMSKPFNRVEAKLTSSERNCISLSLLSFSNNRSHIDTRKAVSAAMDGFHQHKKQHTKQHTRVLPDQWSRHKKALDLLLKVDENAMSAVNKRFGEAYKNKTLEAQARIYSEEFDRDQDSQTFYKLKLEQAVVMCVTLLADVTKDSNDENAYDAKFDEIMTERVRDWNITKDPQELKSDRPGHPQLCKMQVGQKKVAYDAYIKYCDALFRLIQLLRHRNRNPNVRDTFQPGTPGTPIPDRKAPPVPPAGQAEVGEEGILWQGAEGHANGPDFNFAPNFTANLDPPRKIAAAFRRITTPKHLNQARAIYNVIKNSKSDCCLRGHLDEECKKLGVDGANATFGRFGSKWTHLFQVRTAQSKDGNMIQMVKLNKDHLRDLQEAYDLGAKHQEASGNKKPRFY